jgi:hypothetical protein
VVHAKKLPKMQFCLRDGSVSLQALATIDGPIKNYRGTGNLSVCCIVDATKHIACDWSSGRHKAHVSHYGLSGKVYKRVVLK